MTIELRNTGISLVGDMPWGTHFCCFYETTQDLLDILVPYFKAGLENNEFGLWVISNSELLTVQEAISALRNAVPALDRHLAERRIEVVEHDEWFLEAGAFDFHRVVTRFKEKLDEAVARGYIGMRVNGSPAWLENKQQLREFEQELDTLFLNERMIASCSYPLAESGAAELLDVARTHQFAIARRQGNWEVLETPELLQAKQEIQRLNEELEQRVEQRTRLLAAAEARYRTLIEQIPAIIYTAVLDERSRTLYVSPQVEAILGFTPEEWMADPELWLKQIHPDDYDMVLASIAPAQSSEVPVTLEYRAIARDGQVVWLHDTASVVRDATGTPLFLQGVSVDITDRKQAEQARRESEERYRSLIEATPSAIVVADMDTRISMVTPQAVGLFGFGAADEMLGRSIFEHIAPEDHEKATHKIQAAVENGTGAAEYTLLRKDGSRFLADLHAAVCTDEAGRSQAITGVLRDITEQRKAELALQASEERYRGLVEVSPDAIAQVDTSAVIRVVSQQTVAMLGYSGADELIGRSAFDFIAPEDHEKARAGLSLVLTHGRVRDLQYTLVRCDGSRLDAELNARLVVDGEGGPQTIIAVVRDITERKRAEDDRRKQQEILQKIFDYIPLMIVFADAGRRIQLVNREWERILGVPMEEVRTRGLDIYEALYPEPIERQAVLRFMAESHGEWADFRPRLPDGRVIDTTWAMIQLSDGTSIAIGQDITERKQAESERVRLFEQLQHLSRQLLRAQEAERRHLARELHDEIGQQLTGISLMLADAIPDASQANQSRLPNIQAQMHHLIQQVRTIARVLRPAVLDDLGLIPALVWLFERYTSQTGIVVRFEHVGLEDRRFSPDVEITTFRIIQEALTNVARHAGIHEVTVRLWADDEALSLMITDQGQGFDPATLDPTTSNGLTGMQERAALLGGSLTVESVPGGGTHLTATLPLSSDARADGSTVYDNDPPG